MRIFFSSQYIRSCWVSTWPMTKSASVIAETAMKTDNKIRQKNRNHLEGKVV
jgi:hypothetical protein